MDKVYTTKISFGIKGSLGGQNIYCKKWLRWIKYIL